MIGQVLPRTVSFPILLVAWGVWLAGLIVLHALLPLGVVIANLLAAQGLYSTSLKLPRGPSAVLQALGLGLSLLALGDLVLTYEWLFELYLFSEPLFLCGTLTFALAGASLPWTIERLGLHARGMALRVSLLAVGGAGALTWVAASFSSLPWPEPAYYFVPFFLTLLFFLEVRLMIGDRIKRSLRNIVWALLLVSFARVIALFAGDQSAGLNLLNQALYGMFWLGGMSFLTWNTSR